MKDKLIIYRSRIFLIFTFILNCSLLFAVNDESNYHDYLKSNLCLSPLSQLNIPTYSLPKDSDMAKRVKDQFINNVKWSFSQNVLTLGNELLKMGFIEKEVENGMLILSNKYQKKVGDNNFIYVPDIATGRTYQVFLVSYDNKKRVSYIMRDNILEEYLVHPELKNQFNSQTYECFIKEFRKDETRFNYNKKRIQLPHKFKGTTCILGCKYNDFVIALILEDNRTSYEVLKVITTQGQISGFINEKDNKSEIIKKRLVWNGDKLLHSFFEIDNKILANYIKLLVTNLHVGDSPSFCLGEVISLPFRYSNREGYAYVEKGKTEKIIFQKTSTLPEAVLFPIRQNNIIIGFRIIENGKEYLVKFKQVWKDGQLIDAFINATPQKLKKYGKATIKQYFLDPFGRLQIGGKVSWLPLSRIFGNREVNIELDEGLFQEILVLKTEDKPESIINIIREGNFVKEYKITTGNNTYIKRWKLIWSGEKLIGSTLQFTKNILSKYKNKKNLTISNMEVGQEGMISVGETINIPRRFRKRECKIILDEKTFLIKQIILNKTDNDPETIINIERKGKIIVQYHVKTDDEEYSIPLKLVWVNGVLKDSFLLQPFGLRKYKKSVVSQLTVSNTGLVSLIENIQIPSEYSNRQYKAEINNYKTTQITLLKTDIHKDVKIDIVRSSNNIITGLVITEGDKVKIIDYKLLYIDEELKRSAYRTIHTKFFDEIQKEKVLDNLIIEERGRLVANNEAISIGMQFGKRKASAIINDNKKIEQIVLSKTDKEGEINIKVIREKNIITKLIYDDGQSIWEVDYQLVYSGGELQLSVLNNLSYQHVENFEESIIKNIKINTLGKVSVAGEIIPVGLKYKKRKCFAILNKDGAQRINIEKGKKDDEIPIYVLVFRDKEAIKRLEFFDAKTNEKLEERNFILLKWDNGYVNHYTQYFSKYYLGRILLKKQFSGILEGIRINKSGGIKIGDYSFWIPQAKSWKIKIKYEQGVPQLLYLIDENEVEQILNPKDYILKLSNDWTQDKQELFEKNVWYVRKIAFKYIYYAKILGLSLEDLIDEGENGLREAIIKFDPRWSTKLYLFSTNFIKRYIWDLINEVIYSYGISIEQKKTLRKLYQVKIEFEKEFGKQPTPEDVCEKLNIDMEEYYYLKDIEQAIFHSIKLEDNLFDEDTSFVKDFLPDKTIPSPVDFLLNQEIVLNLNFALKKLSKDKQLIINSSFGLDDEAILPEELAKKMNISIEELLKLQESALSDLSEILSNLKDQPDFEINDNKSFSDVNDFKIPKRQSKALYEKAS